MNEQDFAQRLLALLNRNPNVNLNDYFRNDPAFQEFVRITQFRHYRGDEQQQLLKLIIPALVESVGMQIPGLIETKEIFIPALIEVNKVRFGDAAVLFYTVEKLPGPVPGELCRCNRRFAPTLSGCVQVDCASQEGRYQSEEECSSQGYGGSATVQVYSCIDPLGGAEAWQGGFADGWFRPFPGNDERQCYVVLDKVSGRKITGFVRQNSGATPSYWQSSDAPNVPIPWSEVDVYYVGTRYGYSEGSGIRSDLERVALGNFPLAGAWGVNGTTPPPTGSVFYESFTYDANGVMREFFTYRGTINSWANRSYNLPSSSPPGSIDPVTLDYEGKYRQITFWLGGHTEQPIKLGSYLLRWYDLPDEVFPEHYGFKPKTNITGAIDGSVLPFICAVGPGQYQVVIKHGKWKQRNLPIGSQPDPPDNIPWCGIDVYNISGSSVAKTSYSNLSPINLHPKNWAAKFLSNWYFNKYIQQNTYSQYTDQAGDDRMQIAWEKEGFEFDGFRHYLIRNYNFLKYRSDPYNNENIVDGEGKILAVQGCLAGRFWSDANYLNDRGCSFATENQKVYAIDCNLNQWIEIKNDLNQTIASGVLADLIETHDIKTASFKCGEVEMPEKPEQSSEADYNWAFIVQDYINSLKFKSPTALKDKKIYSLKKENPVLIDMVAGVDLPSVKQSTILTLKYKYRVWRILQTYSGDDPVKNYGGPFILSDEYPVPQTKYNFTDYDGNTISEIPIARPFPFIKESEVWQLKNCAGEVVIDLGSNVSNAFLYSDPSETSFNSLTQIPNPQDIVRVLNGVTTSEWKPLVIGFC